MDDEPLILHALARYLEDQAVVKTVNSAEEALEGVCAQHYDLCFLDIVLPGMDGLDALVKIKKISPHTKVVIMSGSCLDEDMERQIEDNAYAFIEKPFELSRIEEVTKEAEAALTG